MRARDQTSILGHPQRTLRRQDSSRRGATRPPAGGRGAIRRRARSRWPGAIAAWVAVAALAPGCISHHYCVRRAALVPVPAPAMRPAREAAGYVEADVSSETALYAKPAKRLAGRNVGLYVPREQIAGQLLFSPHRMVTFGFSYETGLPSGALQESLGEVGFGQISGG